MVVRIRKKATRKRGSHTHGWGSKKKHRGAGNRGGRGMAGSGKRADSIKTLIWKERYFGKKGFKPKNKEKIKSVNLDYLEEKLEEFLEKKLIVKEGEFYKIDLGNLGYKKLLGNGKVKNKLKIYVDYASRRAIEKVKGAGGDVILKKSTEGAKELREAQQD